MIDKLKYKNYFKNHYKYDFSEKDLARHYNWFHAQWIFIQKKVVINKKFNVLEIGSSIGSFAQFLEKIGLKNVTGIDLDNDAVSFAKKRFPEYFFLNEPIEKFSKKKKFDLIFSFEVLEHVDSPKRTIEDIYALLNKSGHFIGTSPFPYVKNVYADKTHQYVLHPSNWKKLFYEAGFRDVKTYPMTFLPYLWRINKLFNIRIPFYLPFFGFISTTMIIAKK